MRSKPQGYAVTAHHDEHDHVLAMGAGQMIPFEARFVSNLRAAIADQLTTLHTELGSGTLIMKDETSTALKCVRHMGVIAGLKSALAAIEQVENEMSGKTAKKKGE